MTRKGSLLELAGILTDKEAKTIQKHVKEANQKMSKRIHKTWKQQRKI